MSVTKANTTLADPTISKGAVILQPLLFYAQNLMGFNRNHLHQLDPAKSCLTIFANFLGRHLVGVLEARKQKTTHTEKCFLCELF